MGADTATGSGAGAAGGGAGAAAGWDTTLGSGASSSCELVAQPTSNAVIRHRAMVIRDIAALLPRGGLFRGGRTPSTGILAVIGSFVDSLDERRNDPLERRRILLLGSRLLI
jgi:hypothetical protein